jgi:hypothetical protein
MPTPGRGAGAAHDARPVVELAPGQLEVLRGEGGGAAVDDLAHPGEELVLGLGEVAPDHDDRRVEEVDGAGQDLADEAPGLAHERDRLGVARPHQRHDVPAVVGLHADGLQLAGQGAPTGHGLDAAPVAAPAQGVAGVGDLHVAKVAGGAVGAPVDDPAGHDPAADAGGDLDEQQVVDRVAPARPVLAERHDVDVVVHEHRHPGVRGGEGGGHGHPVPARHDRRADGPAGGELDRAGQADADAAHVGRAAAGLGQQHGEALVQPGQHDLGPAGDVHLGGLLDDQRAVEVADPQPAVGGAHVGAQHHPAGGVERELGGWAAAGGCAAALLDQQAQPEQGVDPLGHGGPRQPGGAGQVGAAGGLAVPDELEQDPGREDMGADVARGHARVVTRQALFGQRSKL